MELLAVVLAIAGLGAGYGISTYTNKKKNADFEEKADKELAKAKKEANKLLDDAREEARKVSDDARREEQTRRNELKDLENRLVQRESTLDKKLDEGQALVDQLTEQERQRLNDDDAVSRDDVRDSLIDDAAANARRPISGVGSTGVPTERSTMPSECAEARALAPARESQGKSGRLRSRTLTRPAAAARSRPDDRRRWGPSSPRHPGIPRCRRTAR